MTSPRRQRAVRVFGVLTAAYGVSAILRPQTLARWTGLGDPASPGAAETHSDGGPGWIRTSDPSDVNRVL